MKYISILVWSSGMDDSITRGQSYWQWLDGYAPYFLPKLA